VKRRTSVAIAASAVAATVLTVVLAASSDVLATPLASAAVRGATVAGWTLCGLRTWERRPDSPLGAVMVGGGFAYGIGILNALDSPAAFTLGSVLWVAGAYLVTYVALAFPTGRLPDRLSRVIALSAAGGSALLWTVLLLGAPTMPTPARPFRCAEDCPPNPFDLLGLSDAAATAIARGAFGLFGVCACLLVAILLVRMRAAGPASRRVLLPPALCLCTVAFAFAFAFVVARTPGDDALREAVGWAPSVTAVGFPFLLLLGQARGRLFTAASLRAMVRRLPASSTRRNLEAVMADALGDPSLRLAFPVGRGRFVDGTGAPIALAPDARVAVTEIRDGSEITAAVLHDPVLDDPPGVVQAAGGAILLALENARLEADVRASARALRESRARLLTAGVAERRRLERDLHDTAQQRLVALRIRFALAQERVDDELGPVLEQLGAEVEATIDSVRAVGRDLYPPLLADQGLAAALRSTLAVMPSEVGLDVDGLGRGDRDVEAAVYLCCRALVELLAGGAAARPRLTLRVEAAELQIAVACVAAADVPSLRSRVLVQMRDHVGTLGGRVVHADDPDGWSVKGVVPWPAGVAGTPG
jgi:signal transduction histidine kinase